MIAFLIYIIIFAGLILANGFFNLFKDQQLTRKTFAVFFILKAMAVPAFYFLYLKLYGGIENLDAGKFYSDVRTMNELAYSNFSEFLKMLLGLQDDSDNSLFHRIAIENTFNWDNGRLRDFFYNDNRVLIRIHSLLHFIAFNSYFVHALFSCILSFVGATFIYRSFKQYFSGNEIWLFIVVCFFPSLWVFSGGLLKEGLTVFFLGAILLQLKTMIESGFTFSSFIILPVSLFFATLLKPYILLSAALCFGLFFALKKREMRKTKLLIFFLSLASIGLAVNGAFLLFKHLSIPQAAFQRQKEFADLAKGGIFLLDSSKFVRLEYNYDLITRVGSANPPDLGPAKLPLKDVRVYKIKKNVSFVYWEHSHQQDTLYCKANADTARTYVFVYDLKKAGSNLNIISYSGNAFTFCLKALFYPLIQPFFSGSDSFMRLMICIENIFLLLSVILVLAGLVMNKKENFFPLTCLVFGLSIFLIIGITTPNIGALVRYRSPAAFFVILAGVYYLADIKDKKAANAN